MLTIRNFRVASGPRFFVSLERSASKWGFSSTLKARPSPSYIWRPSSSYSVARTLYGERHDLKELDPAARMYQSRLFSTEHLCVKMLLRSYLRILLPTHHRCQFFSIWHSTSSSLMLFSDLTEPRSSMLFGSTNT